MAEKYDTYGFEKLADEIAKAELNIEDIYDALNTPFMMINRLLIIKITVPPMIGNSTKHMYKV